MALQVPPGSCAPSEARRSYHPPREPLPGVTVSLTPGRAAQGSGSSVLRCPPAQGVHSKCRAASHTGMGPRVLRCCGAAPAPHLGMQSGQTRGHRQIPGGKDGVTGRRTVSRSGRSSDVRVTGPRRRWPSPSSW